MVASSDLWITYLLGGDHDTDLLDGLGELIGLDGTGVVKIKELESLHENGLFAGVATGLLVKLVQKLFLETLL